jgi:mRNA degradation ribonuclease J1/J2
MGWDGMGWDGMGWDGMGWDGIGWDGMGWDGMGWDGMGYEIRRIETLCPQYIGLSKKWAVKVYASAVTAALVRRRLGVSAEQLVVLPMDTPVEVAGGTRVTCIDANHCPGAVLLLFHLPDGRCVLHTGDFRYDSLTMRRHPALAAIPDGGLHALYLDTTYLDPKHTFPTQAAVVRHVVDQCRLLTPCQRTLVLFGAYSIGKERVFLQVRATGGGAAQAMSSYAMLGHPLPSHAVLNFGELAACDRSVCFSAVGGLT